MAEDKNIPQKVPPSPTPEVPQDIPLSKIHPLPGIVPRRRIDRDLGGLVQSIKSQGVMEPVVLRLREDGEYQLVSGYRRLWASEMAQKRDIRAIVRTMTLKEAQDCFERVKDPDFKGPIPGKPVLPEKTKDTSPTSGKESAEIRALALEIGGMKGDRVTGTVYELDYSQHVEVMKKEALHVHNVSVTYEDGYTQVFPHVEYEQGDEVTDLECVHGAFKDVNFLAQDRRELEQLLAANFPLPRQRAKRHNRDLTHRR